MARVSEILTIREIARCTKLGRYADGGGLYLQVGPSGGRAWIFRYEYGGRERRMGLGPYPDVSLDHAREAARTARQQLRNGIDPLEAKRASRDAERQDKLANITFKKAAIDYLRLHEANWKNDKHKAQWHSTLEHYVYKDLGNRPVRAIDDALINATLTSIWTTIPETASRVRQRIQRIRQWVLDGQPLPVKPKARRVVNHPALPYVEVAAFMADLRQREGQSARALEFLILTAARTGEVIGARWDEIDLLAKVWTIPAERMKAGKLHKVPLSGRAIEILQELPREDGNDFVFLGARSGYGLSNMAMLELLRGMRAGCVVHGFRSTFRTWCAEQTNFPREIAEAALAHTVKGVEGKYQRGDMLAKRVKLMEAWANYAGRPAAQGATVVAMQRVAA